MGRQIKICETATLKVMPDTTSLRVTVTVKDESTALAVEQAEAHLAELFDTLVDVGVLRDDIKTEGFNIYPEYKHIRDNNENYVNVIVAYVCTNSLILEFGLDSEFLTNIITALSCLESMPEIAVTFKLNNTADTEEQLVELVTEKALFKAKAFCKSLGMKLGELASVDYCSEEGRRRSDVVCFARSEGGAAVGIGDTTPKEIELTERASFVWEIY